MAQWEKIGEVTIIGELFRKGVYNKYVVLEKINNDGTRKYKRIFVASDSYRIPDVKLR
jgi:hypothetical protein